ncbi:hypothetical protein [Arthrobacter sp. CG_A4]|uniref:hypothetical protein n=1 Tax=Arthrobacter sp. CG_A4 TaxID=3071706 RepID=UPI002E0AB165|nr:hypothetical protein [Arthrobacter sp. CG_A4]
MILHAGFKSLSPMTKSPVLMGLTCLIAVAATLAGCDQDPPLISPVPYTGKELDRWAERMAEANGAYSAPTDLKSVTTIICRLLPERDDMNAYNDELAKIKGLDRGEARTITTIAVFGYCPEFKDKLTENHYKTPFGRIKLTP